MRAMIGKEHGFRGESTVSASQWVTSASDVMVVQVTHLSSGPSFQSLNSLSKAECAS